MDMGELSKIVGIEITQDENSITIKQSAYITEILRNHGMEDTHAVKTPLDLNIKLEKNPEGTNGDQSNLFASLIGSLQYLAMAMCPDIAFTVNQLAAYTANPSMAHWMAAKRILQYLAGTKQHGITYRADATHLQGDNLVHGYANAAFANNENMHSTTGYIFTSYGGAITWGSKRQNLIAYSSTEAEYIVVSEVV